MQILLNFQDTSGQERYQKLIPLSYIRNSHVVFLVFSDFDSLENLKRRWFNFYKKNSNVDNSKFILVGNKSDLYKNNRDELRKSIC